MSDQTSTNRVSHATQDGARTTVIDGEDLPHPIVRKRRWPAWLIWLVPVIALVIAGFYLRGRFEDRGPVITVELTDANGIEIDSTNVRAHGVEIGKVMGVTLGDDDKTALVRIQLRHSAAGFAKQGATFWVVKPDFSSGSFSGLGTVLSGPYIEATPGNGKSVDHFTALGAPPPPMTKGLRLLLVSNDLNRVKPGAVVTYRGVKVGSVETVQLARDAIRVEMGIVVDEGYAPLVRTDSKFWAEQPADVHGSIFSGIDLKLGSIRSIFSGEIAFASPDKPLTEPAQPGMIFILHDQAEDIWKTWRPSIDVQPEKDDQPPTSQPSLKVESKG